MLKKLLAQTTKFSILLLFAIGTHAQTSLSVSEIKTNGVGGFPQKSATLLVDSENFRVSIANDSNYLAVQAIVWNDDNDESGKNSAGQTSGDYSALVTAIGNGDKLEPNIDRVYYVNPRPQRKGLYYTIYLGKRKVTETLPNGKEVTYEAEASSRLINDTKGKGKIEYVTADGRKVRVDTMLIPLSEFGGKSLKEIRLCYFASSPNPALKFNSCGYEPRTDYFDFNIPVKAYRKFVLKTDLVDEFNKLKF